MMYGTLRWLACLVALLATMPLTALAGPADDQYAVAAAHYARGRWQFAIDEFTTYLRDYPAHERAGAVRFFLGEALVQLGRYEEAHQQFDLFLERSPQHSYTRQAEFRLGETLFLDGERERCGPMLERFLLRHPSDPLNAFVLPYLGEIALYQKDGVAAERHYRKSLQQYPRGPLVDESRFGLARSLTMLGQSQEALRFFDSLARKRTSHLADAAQLNVGLILYRQGARAEAVTEFEALREHFPTSPFATEARYWQAAAQMADDDFQAAFDVLEPIAADATDHHLADAVRFMRAEALQKLNRTEEALEAYERLVETAAQSEFADDAAQIAIQLEFDAEHYEEALAGSRRFLDAYPTSPLRHLVQQTQARCLLQKKSYAEAASVLNALSVALETELEPDSATGQVLRDSTQFYLAMAYLGDDDQQRALAILTELSDDEHDDKFQSRIDLARASLLVAEKDYANAVDPLQNYLHRNPTGNDRADCLAKLIVCLVELADIQTAAEHHEEYAREHNDHKLLHPTTEYLAQAAHRGQAFELAVELYQQLASDGSPLSYRLQGLGGLGRLYAELGRQEAAAEVLGQLLDLAPESALAPSAALARAHALSGDAQLDAFIALAERYPSASEAAIAAFEAARLLHQRDEHTQSLDRLKWLLEKHPQFNQRDTALYLMAWVQIDLQNQAGSFDAFQQLADEHPESTYWGDAMYRLAERAHAEEDWERLDALFTKLFRIGCSTSIRTHAWYLQAQAAVRRERWADVIGPMQKVVRESDDPTLTVSARYWMAEAYYRQHDYASASPLLDRLEQETAAQSGDWVAMIPLRRAQIAAHEKRWHEALAQAESLKTDYPDFRQHYEADYLIGRCHSAGGRFDEARQAFQRVTQSSQGGRTETAAMAQWMIGESYFHQKEYEAAIREYHRVEALYSYGKWQAAALLQAGKCHELLGEWKQAVRLYAQVIQDHPQTDYAKEAAERLQTARSGQTRYH